MGLPLSLEGVGAVLGLEKQKLTEGKALIKYFCQPCLPTKANSQRTRNRPFHAPDKWELFKRYNARDVEAEMGIQQRLAKFPVSQTVWAMETIQRRHLSRGESRRSHALASRWAERLKHSRASLESEI